MLTLRLFNAMYILFTKTVNQLLHRLVFSAIYRFFHKLHARIFALYASLLIFSVALLALPSPVAKYVIAFFSGSLKDEKQLTIGCLFAIITTPY